MLSRVSDRHMYRYIDVARVIKTVTPKAVVFAETR